MARLGWQLGTVHSPRLTDADGVFLREGVHRGEVDGLGGIFGENQGLERRLIIRREALVVLEHAVDLDLDAAGLAVFHIGHDLKAAVGGPGFVEVDANPNPLRDLIARPALARMGGSIRLSDRPGLGLSDDWGAIAGLRRAHEY